MSVRVLVLRSAGTNNDLETVQAFQAAGATAERIHVQSLIDRKRRLDEFHILSLPGGFSYGDDLGAGTVLANQLRANLLGELQEFVASGRQVIGICNGFQILVRLGLLPVPGGGKTVSLVENVSGHFESRWVRLRVATASSPILEADEILEMPVAHLEGRLVVASPEIYQGLVERDQIAFRYTDASDTREDPGYPHNPNGSIGAVAGLQSPCGRVLGMMPHPERHLRALHHPEWTRRRAAARPSGGDWTQGDGFRIFGRMVETARQTLEASTSSP